MLLESCIGTARSSLSVIQQEDDEDLTTVNECFDDCQVNIIDVSPSVIGKLFWHEFQTGDPLLQDKLERC